MSCETSASAGASAGAFLLVCGKRSFDSLSRSKLCAQINQSLYVEVYYCTEAPFGFLKPNLV
jgi:hypothetical protein